jgi:hypothetical protein
MDAHTREKLLGGIDNLHGQKGQLENTKRVGLETHDIMRQANKELRDQRDIIVSVDEKNREMQVDLHLASKTVNQMSVREFFYRAALYGAIILLLVAIIGLIIAKIVKK